MQYNMQNRVPKNAAGFRISTITNYTEEGVVAGKKTFRYGKTNREVYGRQLCLPQPTYRPGAGNRRSQYIDLFGFFLLPQLLAIITMILGLNEYGERVSF